MTTNSRCILREHNVVLNKYGQDLYIDEEIITSSYPDEKGRKENCLKLIGNLEFLMDKKHPDNHAVFLTVDGVRELNDYLRMWLEKQVNGKRHLIKDVLLFEQQSKQPQGERV